MFYIDARTERKSGTKQIEKIFILLPKLVRPVDRSSTAIVVSGIRLNIHRAHIYIYGINVDRQKLDPIKCRAMTPMKHSRHTSIQTHTQESSGPYRKYIFRRIFFFWVYPFYCYFICGHCKSERAHTATDMHAAQQQYTCVTHVRALVSLETHIFTWRSLGSSGRLLLLKRLFGTQTYIHAHALHTYGQQNTNTCTHAYIERIGHTTLCIIRISYHERNATTRFRHGMVKWECQTETIKNHCRRWWTGPHRRTHTVNTHYHTHVSQKNWRARLGMPNRRTPMETNDCDCMSVWLRLCACVCIFYSRRPSGADNNNNNNEAYNINSRDDDDGPRSFVSLFNIHSIPYTYE